MMTGMEFIPWCLLLIIAGEMFIAVISRMNIGLMVNILYAEMSSR